VQFLIDACLPRDFTPLLASFGHISIDVRDIGMGRADDPDIAAHALAHQLCLLTEDWGFADIRRYPPTSYHGIVVIETADNGIDQKLAALGNLLERDDIVSALPGRLAVVTPTRIRLRPPL
jgi:predicted nuclease of predicted toxin-antitoxin system